MRRLFGPLFYGASHAFDLAATEFRQRRPRSVADVARATESLRRRALSSSEQLSAEDARIEHSQTQARAENQIHSNRLFVGSLPFTVTDDDLRAVFAAAGEVLSAKVIMDRYTGRSKGFGFVEMAHITIDDILLLDGHPIGGRRIKINKAKAMPERPPRSSWYPGEGDRNLRLSDIAPERDQPAAETPEVVQPPAETSEAEEIGSMVDEIFVDVQIVWEGTDKARQSDELLRSRR